MTCTWVKWCSEPGVHLVWRQTRPGLIVDDIVCERHLQEARAAGYHADPPPVPTSRTIDVDDEAVE